jgi:transcriptional regulator with XRE-family HTH domain
MTRGRRPRCRDCSRLSGLGHPLCAVRTFDNVTTIARCACRDRVLIQRRLASQITWEAYARAAGPALVHYPVFPTWGPLRVGGLHTENGKQHRTMPSPHPIDIHVGLRIRQRRRLLDMSQQTLGAAVGLSFQMIQRYEDGSTSIPASTLFELARALDVPPSCFFQGPRLTARDPLCTQETVELVRAYFTIHNPTVRENIAKAIRAVSHHRGS